jgi:multidrug efflux pump
VRVSGQLTSKESLKAINLRVNDRIFPLTDEATIKRGYLDPPTSLFRFKGQPAIGLAIGMTAGSNLLEFGKALDAEVKKVVTDLPISVAVERVPDQPAVVDEAVSGFTYALFEAIAIVLVVSFLSLVMRVGLVVAVSITLGLLVDDAMIAVEMVVSRLEAGDDIRKAATAVYTSTAFPMLTGTLVTGAGFISIGLNSSAAGEFTFTLFVVIAVSLTVSWIVAVLFTPLFGVVMLSKTMKSTHENKGRFARGFAWLLGLVMRWRWVTIVLTLAAFVFSLGGMSLVQQQFFLASDRSELIVDWSMPQNTTIAETNRQMAQFEKEKLVGKADIDHWSTYVGEGAPRFILSYDVQSPAPWFGQVVIVAKDLEARE